MSFDDPMKKYGVQNHSADVQPTKPPKRQPNGFQENTVTASPEKPSKKQSYNNPSRPSPVSTHFNQSHTSNSSVSAHSTPSVPQSGIFGSETTSAERENRTTDCSWDNAGSFGSNDDMIHTGDRLPHSFSGFEPINRRGQIRIWNWPWIDIIFIVMIIVEVIVLLANLDALFYAILPFVRDLVLLLIIGGVVVLVLYFLFGRHRR